MGWVIDLDGVVWLADEPIAGAADAVAMLRAHGETVAFVTNNSFAPRAEVARKLARHGIEAGDDVVTSAMAAASLLGAGERVFVCGGPGIEEAVEKVGAHVVTDAPADAVVVGFDPSFDYDRMRRAATFVRGGARLVATNDDATYPTPEGPVPGAGSILASIETAAGTTASVAGKPHPPMADLVRAHVGGDGWVVGDRPETDGCFAEVLGFRFGLVLTGVTGPGDLPVAPTPDAVAADLLTLVAERHGVSP